MCDKSLNISHSMYEIPCKSVSNKCLHGAAVASVTTKKARLKAVLSMSCESITFITTSPPASLAAAAEVAVPCSEMSSLLPAGASASGSSPAPPTAVATLPLSPANTVTYDPVWLFREELRESLISETVTLRSSIHSFSPAAHLSPAQNTAELSSQSSTVSSSSFCEKASIQSLTGITTCLHCIKQLKKRRILYTCLFSHFCYFCYICNNDFYLSITEMLYKDADVRDFNSEE
ncbi:uncharacterized protein BDCG_16578 [Blastomyces dermatitidis ER-3]|uniref:Uncharacterized protein n=1 Tax=Ajellomyces dermatitidis (strain ER-3 / ATCC MYA-2586) TaxID=559297 RepID=A0ABX2VSX6_AJEDR|nr:uncharacterized protein BDCG_16578 [Blastomyces dermatitidis ER-3]OAT00311.1 hypothetical protein BDCG_16578 [Blastomyces dermatitidis ER-3]